ncbi:MAG: HAD family hydrolase [Spirochaetales bacterium]|nr:HAD family hydrolase [Spirochaetales bacterium]
MKAVLFDLFNTLINQYDPDFSAAPKLTDITDLPDDIFLADFELTRKDRHLGKLRDLSVVYQQIAAGHNASIDNAALDKFNRYWGARIDESLRNPDAEILNMLGQLKANGIRTAIITNCEHSEIEIIEKSRIADCAEFVVYSARAGIAKPYKGIYAHALDRLGLPGSECLYIGDGADDELEGAAQAGIRAYQAFWFLKQYDTEFLADKYRPFPRLYEPAEVIDLVG